MAKSINAREMSLAELQEKFHLQRTTDAEFFPEWQIDLPPVTAAEADQLNRLKQNYLNLASRKVFSEEAVKMVVLSPLLDLAGFYQAPFGIQTEEPIEIKAEEGELSIKGNIDILVVLQRFWVLVVESKSTQFDVLTALPQALTYMLTVPEQDKPVYGLLANGREFVFVKLVFQPDLVYSRSYALSVERDDELAQVLSTLKFINQTVIELNHHSSTQ